MRGVGPLQKFSLDGRTALVTGASDGLGRHFATVLGAAGASVVACARRIDKLNDLVAHIRSAGGRAEAIAMDITDRASVVEALRFAGNIDVLINNAGVSETRSFFDYTDAHWDAIIDTNLKGAWTVAQETARCMHAAGRGGTIINVTSVLASRVVGGVGPYAAAKAGLKHLTRSMALELARFGIRVNSLAPGYVATRMNREFLSSEAGERLKARIPARRVGEAEDLDGALLLLASPAGAYITGCEIVVDGGHLCAAL